jgi:hypothetical protein
MEEKVREIEFLWSHMCALNALMHFVMEELGPNKIIEALGDDDAAAVFNCLPKITQAFEWGHHCVLREDWT